MKTYFKTEEDIDQFVYWLCCLLMEVIPKGIGSLEDANNPGHYCCLGVGVLCTTERIVLGNNNIMRGGYPSEGSQPDTPKWLRGFSYECDQRRFDIADANDGNYHIAMSHPRIARKLIELFKEDLGPYYQEIKTTFGLK